MEKSLALLVRQYTPKPEEVEDRAARALKIALAANQLFLHGKLAFKVITFLVPVDYDCGETARAIRNKLRDAHLEGRTLVLEATGYHSCEALNEAVQALHNLGDITNALIMSGKAASSLTEPVLKAIDDAFAAGAKVVGVAVDELAEIVLEGRVQNTFCGWKINPLLIVGGFKAKNGVEEIGATIRLLRMYSQCIAVLDPMGKKPLDILQTETGRARHVEVMETKTARQIQEAKDAGVDFTFIKRGIMPGYPKVL